MAADRQEVKNIVEILKDLSTQAIGTLAQGVALAINVTHATGLLADFLMKRVTAEVLINDFDSLDTLIVGMARGDATVTEIKAAIELTQLERDLQSQANVRVVLHETVRFVAESGTDNKAMIEASLGGGKGIPFEKGDGWQWFAYNHGANDQVAGAIALLQATYYGVWL